MKTQYVVQARNVYNGDVWDSINGPNSFDTFEEAKQTMDKYKNSSCWVTYQVVERVCKPVEQFIKMGYLIHLQLEKSGVHKF
jgi:hypothetical protein